MLSRVLTRREQLVLLALAGGLVVGSATLYFMRRPAHADPPATPDLTAALPAPTPELPPMEPAAVAPAASFTEAEPPAPPVDPPIAVSVRGAVACPDVYEFKAGARVQEALERAGGPLESADLSDINLAARLLDGSTLTVPERLDTEGIGGRLSFARTAPAPNPPEYTISGWQPVAAAPAGMAPASGASATAVASEGGLLNLNSATEVELQALPGIGPKLASDIVRYRADGSFTRVEDILNVSGIGPKRLEAIRPFVTVR